MNLKIGMCMRACTWDNDLVNQKEEQMKPIEITKQDVLGYEHTFVVRHDTSTNKAFLAEVDPDFGFESFRGVFGSIEAALDRIETFIH